MDTGQFYKESDFKQSAIGPIPSNWDVVRLEDVCEVLGGGTPSTSIKEYWNGDIPFATPTDVTGLEDQNVNFLNNTKSHITDQGLKNSSTHLLPVGSVLVTSRATIGYAVISEVPVATNQGFVNLICKDRVHNVWLLHLVRSLRTKLESLGAGSTYKEVSRGTVRNLAICLPSKVEQKKIGEILSHTDEAIRKTNQIISNIERLRKGLLQKLLTRGIGHKEFKYSEELGTEIPMKWKIGRISDYCSVGTGGTPSRKHPEYFDGDMPWVKSTEIDYGMITRSEESISSLGLRNSNAKVYPVGTLVIAMYGQGVTRGRCAILGIEAAINQACAAILPKDVDETHIPFLYNWCQFNYEKIRNLGQGANQLNLNLSLVRSIAVALPPFEEQKRITEILESVERKLDLERKEKAKVEKAKQGLMNLLLAGKIRIKVD